MHQLGAPNSTAVAFGALPYPINARISPVSLSVLRSSLIEVFLQTTNLTLTTSTFGHPSRFEILKFQGGITVIPVQPASIWQMPQILFNFTLNNSISEILDNIVELKDQLKFGLHLRPYEVCHLLNFLYSFLLLISGFHRIFPFELGGEGFELYTIWWGRV